MLRMIIRSIVEAARCLDNNQNQRTARAGTDGRPALPSTETQQTGGSAAFCWLARPNLVVEK
jgi:hypothetical protein